MEPGRHIDTVRRKTLKVLELVMRSTQEFSLNNSEKHCLIETHYLEHSSLNGDPYIANSYIRLGRVQHKFLRYASFISMFLSQLQHFSRSACRPSFLSRPCVVMLGTKLPSGVYLSNATNSSAVFLSRINFKVAEYSNRTSTMSSRIAPIQKLVHEKREQTRRLRLIATEHPRLSALNFFFLFNYFIILRYFY